MAQEQLDWQIRLSADESAARRAVQTINAVDTAGNKVKLTLGEYGPVAKAAMRNVEVGFRGLDRTFKDHRSDIEGLRREWIDYEQAAERAAQAAKQAASVDTSGGGAAAAAGRLDRIGSVGSQLASGLGQGEIANVLGLVGDLSGGLETLGTTILPLAILTTGASAAINLYNQRIEENRKAVEKAANAQLDTQDRYYQAIIDGATSEEINAEIEALRRTNEVLNTQKQELVSSIQQSRAAGADVTELDKRLAELQEEMGANAALVDRYRYGLAVGTFAVNDRIKAEEDAAAASEAWMDRRSQNELSFRQQIDGMDAEARGQRIRDIEAEIDLLKEMSLQQGISDEQRQGLVESELLLRQERNYLIDVNHTTADSEKELASIRSQMEAKHNALFDATSKTAEAEGKLIEARNAEAKAAADSEATLEKIRADLRDKEAQINAKAEEALNAATAKAEEQRTKIALDAAKERAKNEETFAKSAKAAQMARDQAAYQQAVEAFNEEQKRINDSEKERLDELEASLKEQRDTILASQRQQQQDAQDSARRLIDTERNRHAQQRADLQGAVAQARVDLQNAQFAEKMIRQNYYAAEQTAAQQQYAALTNMAFQAGQSLVDAFDADVQLALFTSGAMKGGGAIAKTGGEYVPRSGAFGGAGAGGGFGGTLQNNIYLNGVLTTSEARSLINDSFGEFQQTYLNLRRRAA